jgi:hypothetical protein
VNQTSAILRIIAGLGVLIFAASVYASNRARISGNPGATVELFGHQTEAAAWQIQLGFATIALIGIILLVLGIASLRKR